MTQIKRHSPYQFKPYHIDNSLFYSHDNYESFNANNQVTEGDLIFEYLKDIHNIEKEKVKSFVDNFNNIRLKHLRREVIFCATGNNGSHGVISNYFFKEELFLITESIPSNHLLYKKLW